MNLDFYFQTLKAIASQCQTTLANVEAVLYNKPTEAQNATEIKSALVDAGLLLELAA